MGRKDSRSPSPKRKDSRSRSRSKSGDRGGKGGDHSVETIKLTDGDAAFLLGKGGKTKAKIARVSGADLELFERDLILEIRGTDKQRRAARKYSECVMAQRVGPVSLDKYNDGDRDQTIVDVPQDCVGFVTGKAGNFLRTIEEEWCVIVFFVEFSKDRGGRGVERLAIFGERHGRRGAELKVMTAVECKAPGFFSDKPADDKDDDGDWGTETSRFSGDEVSYALGKQGSTRKKLERASECIIQYVGPVCYYSGFKKNRKRAKQYMKWLFAQLDGPVHISDYADRDDCTAVDVPQDTVGYITGSRRAALAQVEAEWGVFMFFANQERGERRSRETLLIFGNERGRQGAQLKVLSSIETKNPGFLSRDMREKISDRSGFDCDRFMLKDEDVSYALGKGGSTRMKLETASGCITQYVGNWCHFAGTKKERSRVKEYLQWLLAQRRGAVTVGDVSDRDDCTEIHVPRNCMGWITGNRGSELRRIEQESATYLFVAMDKHGDERLLIFGCKAGSRVEPVGRMMAERMVNELIQERLRNQGGGGSRSRSRGGRKDSRSPPRRKDSRR